VATLTRLSTDDFLAGDWPAGTELVDGEVVMNDPSFRHQEVTLRLLEALRQWTRDAPGRGRAGFGGNWTPAAGEVYKPDAWWVPHGTEPAGESVRWEGVPALVAEVRSPGTWPVDIGRKRSVYERARVAELWLVDTPARTVIVFRRRKPDSGSFDESVEFGPAQTLTTPLLGGFELPVEALFGE
jgi:Uma2 family endonuclease